MIQLYWLQLYCYNNAKTLCRIQKRATVSRYATKSPPYLGDMMHYRPLPIRHLGGRVPPVPRGIYATANCTYNFGCHCHHACSWFTLATVVRRILERKRFTGGVSEFSKSGLSQSAWGTELWSPPMCSRGKAPAASPMCLMPYPRLPPSPVVVRKIIPAL